MSILLRRFASIGVSRLCILRASASSSASPLYSIRNVRTNITHDASNLKKNSDEDGKAHDYGEAHEDGKAHEEKTEETKFGGGGNNADGPQPPKMSPELVKKLRIYSIVVTLLSFVVTYVALKRLNAGEGSEEHSLIEDLKAEPISMNDFLSKYLSSGEVKRITYLPTQNKAVAWLQEDAIIDGKPAQHKVVVINYNRVEGQPLDQFLMEVRHAEDKLGIALNNGVEVQTVHGFTPVKLIELMIGLGIIIFLATQYGRMIRRKVLEQQAQAAKNGKKPPTS